MIKCIDYFDFIFEMMPDKSFFILIIFVFKSGLNG